MNGELLSVLEYIERETDILELDTSEVPRLDTGYSKEIRE